jgi:hypothetical protein
MSAWSSQFSTVLPGRNNQCCQLSDEIGLDMRRDYVSVVLSVFYSVARYSHHFSQK